jgi:DNA-binding response OmpR family regulator
MRILIVEDAIHVANLLAESVRLQGHEAIVATSGPEALSLLDLRCPDAVFLDIVMPGVSGIDVLRRIRATHPALPVIVITGSASSKQIDEVRRLGVTEVIEKPFVLRHLEAALGNLQAEGS